MAHKKEPITSASLLAGAREFADALSTLALKSGHLPVRTSAVLGAHCVELALKAFLLSRGWTDQGLEKELGHHLARTWTEAAAAGLGVSANAPPWCQLLDSIHDFPYVGRYPPRNGDLVTPHPRDIATQVNDLIGLVDAALRAT